MGPSLIYYNDQIAKSTPRVLQLEWDITGAVTVSPVVANSFTMYGFGAAAFADQAAIDSFLGTTNEFLLAAFDATAMGTDAFACILNMGGQASKVTGLEIFSSAGTNGVTTVYNHCAEFSALTSSTLACEIAVGASGNIAFRSVIASVDGVTAGRLVARVSWIAK